MKKIKTDEKSSSPVYQYSITGLVDVYLGKKFILSCRPEDLKTEQVKFLIRQNGL